MSESKLTPRHVAIIMDGNGRWAQLRGKERYYGHMQGVEPVRAAVRAAIRRETKGVSVFIVSQRASTIRRADKIIVLDDGHVAGIGKHEELYETCPVYREICLSQLSESEVKGA